MLWFYLTHCIFPEPSIGPAKLQVVSYIKLRLHPLASCARLFFKKLRFPILNILVHV